MIQRLSDFLLNRKIRAYRPRTFDTPKRLIDVPSAWKGLEGIIADIVDTFNVPRNICLECGVKFRYPLHHGLGIVVGSGSDM